MPPPDDFDQLEAASLFLPKNIRVLIVSESNKYYKQRQKDNGVAPDITLAEARCFIENKILFGQNSPHGAA